MNNLRDSHTLQLTISGHLNCLQLHVNILGSGTFSNPYATIMAIIHLLTGFFINFYNCFMVNLSLNLKRGHTIN